MDPLIAYFDYFLINTLKNNERLRDLELYKRFREYSYFRAFRTYKIKIKMRE